LRQQGSTTNKNETPFQKAVILSEAQSAQSKDPGNAVSTQALKSFPAKDCGEFLKKNRLRSTRLRGEAIST
jgi:hypothetical protein